MNPPAKERLRGSELKVPNSLRRPATSVPISVDQRLNDFAVPDLPIPPSQISKFNSQILLTDFRNGSTDREKE